MISSALQCHMTLDVQNVVWNQATFIAMPSDENTLHRSNAATHFAFII
jgi:hypothetical protein